MHFLKLCLLLLTVCLCPLQTLSQVARIPMYYDPLLTPSPIVDVKINDLPPMPFVIDSGSSFQFVINEKIARKHKLVKGEKFTADQSGRPYYKCAIQQLAMTTEDKQLIRLGTTEIMIANLGDTFDGYQIDRPVAGVIGGSTFQNIAVRWDFDQKVMEVAMKSDAFAYKENAYRIPLLEQQEGIQVSSVEAQIGKKKVRLSVDTGALECVLPLSFKGEVAKTSLDQGVMSVIDAGGDKTVPFYILPHLTLGTAQVAPTLVALSSSHKDYGLLGMNWLGRFRVTIDRPQKVMILEPRAPETWFQSGYDAVILEQDKGKVSVLEIAAQSQAAQGGLQAGDVIISVDGTKTEGLPGDRVQRLVSGEAGKPAELIVERSVAGSDKPVRVRVSYIRKEMPKVSPPKSGG